MVSVQSISANLAARQSTCPGERREVALTRMSGSSSINEPFTELIAAGRGILPPSVCTSQ